MSNETTRAKVAARHCRELVGVKQDDPIGCLADALLGIAEAIEGLERQINSLQRSAL